jgi:hypothetical protein
MDHTEVKDLPDHLHVPIFIEMMEQLNVAIEKGAFPPSHNFFKADAIGNLAEIARAKVNSLDSLSTTRN